MNVNHDRWNTSTSWCCAMKYCAMKCCACLDLSRFGGKAKAMGRLHDCWVRRSPQARSPDCGHGPRFADRLVRSHEREPLDEGGGPDDAVCRILRVDRWKRKSASTDASGNGQNDKAGFNL